MSATRHPTSAVLISTGVLLFGSNVFFFCTAFPRRCHPQNATMLQETIFFRLTAKAPPRLHTNSSWLAPSLVGATPCFVFLSVPKVRALRRCVRSSSLARSSMRQATQNAGCPTWKILFHRPTICALHPLSSYTWSILVAAQGVPERLAVSIQNSTRPTAVRYTVSHSASRSQEGSEHNGTRSQVL